MRAPVELVEAVQQGQVERVEQALAADSALARSRTANGASLILWALYHGQRDTAEALCRAGAPIGFPEACALGDGQSAETLLANDPGALDRPSDDGYPPLGLAVFFGQKSLARWLVEEGADVNCPSGNAQQVAPIHAAVARQDEDLLRLLLAAGADPDASQQGGLTPLHTAAWHGNQRLAELLLQAGARPDQASAEGKTPLDLARERGQHKWVNWWRGRNAESASA